MDINLLTSHNAYIDVIAKKHTMMQVGRNYNSSMLNCIKMDKKYNWCDLRMIEMFIDNNHRIELYISTLIILCRHEIIGNDKIIYINRDIIFKHDKQLYTYLSPRYHTTYKVTTKEKHISIPVVLGISFYEQPESVLSIFHMIRTSQYIRQYYDREINDKKICVMEHNHIYYDGIHVVSDKRLNNIKIRMYDTHIISSKIHTYYEYNKKQLDMCCFDTLCDIISIKYNISNNILHNIKKYLEPNDINEHVYYIKQKSYKPISHGYILIEFDQNITGTIILSTYNELLY